MPGITQNMIFSAFHIFSLFSLFSQFSQTNSLVYTTSLKTIPIIKNIITDYKQDVNFIHKFKDVFDIESYNDILQNLKNNEIEKVYIDTHYKELVFFDNINFDSIDGLQDHYHLSFIDPMIVNDLIQKINDHHVPLYFVDFTSDELLNVVSDASKIFGQIAGIMNSGFLFLLTSFLFYRVFNKMFLFEKN